MINVRPPWIAFGIVGLEIPGRQLEQQLETARREKKDVAELLEFLERKRSAEPPI